MKKIELMTALGKALKKSGFPGAKILTNSYDRTLEETLCSGGRKAPVSVFLFTPESQPPIPERYIAALPLDERHPAIAVGKERESREDLADRVVEEACARNGCQENPDACLFAPKVRTRPLREG